MMVRDAMVPVVPLKLPDIVAGASLPAVDFLPIVDAAGKLRGVLPRPVAVLLASGRLDAVRAEEWLWTDVPAVSEALDIESLTVNAACVVVDAAGRPVGVLSIPAIATYFRQRLFEIQDWFDTVINSAQNGILAVDGQGRITVANRIVAELLNLPQNELVGRHVAEVIPHTCMPQILSSGKPLLGHKITIGSAVVLANGQPRFRREREKARAPTAHSSRSIAPPYLISFWNPSYLAMNPALLPEPGARVTPDYLNWVSFCAC